MNDFQLFNQLLATHSEPTDKPTVTKVECQHKDIIAEKGFSLCKSCGIEVSQKIRYVKECSYYGTSDSKNSSDPSRCYIRKNTDRTIHTDLQDVQISEHIKDKANDIFHQVCNRIRRANLRKGIVFGCVFFAFKYEGDPQSCDSLIKKFHISKKKAKEGLNFVNDNLPHRSPLLSIHITDIDLMREFMFKFNTSDEQCEEVIALYKTIKGKSSALVCRKPQSIAAGMIYYYTLLKRKPISIKEFIKKVNLSELTVIQTARECSRLFGTPEII